MKLLQKHLTRIAVMLAGLFFSVAAFAQDKGTDINVDINKGNSNWYSQPWVWIVGVAVFILLLVALLRGSGRRSAD